MWPPAFHCLAWLVSRRRPYLTRFLSLAMPRPSRTSTGPLNPFHAQLRNQEIRTAVDRLRLSTPQRGKSVPLFQRVENFTIAKAWHALDKLRWDLINSDKHFEQLVGKYSGAEKQLLVSIVMRYFLHLRYRLRRATSLKLNYLTVIDPETYPFDDFAVYGPRFWYALVLSKIFPQYLLESFALLLHKYLKLIPVELLHFREKFLTLKKCLSSHNTRPERIEVTFDRHMMSYEPVDEGKMHSELSELPSSADQVHHFLQRVVPTEANASDRDRFYQVLAQALLLSPELTDLGGRLLQTGSSSNCLALFDSGCDLMFELTRGWNHTYDYTTTRLVLVVLQSLLYAKLGMKNAGFELFYSEPILGKINFQHAFPSIADPSLVYKSVTLTVNAYSEVVNSQFLGRVVAYDDRFRQVTLLLKYWHSLSGLSREKSIGSYPLTLMVAFALQQTQPSVLPPLELILTEEDSVPPSENSQSTEELLVHFIRYYVDFDYEYDCICPRSALAKSRAVLCCDDSPSGESVPVTAAASSFEEAVIALEDPLQPTKNPLLDCSAEALEEFCHLLEALAKKVTPENVILELTRPQDQPF